MTKVTGIVHSYVTVSNPERSEVFCDQVMAEILGFRKDRFSLDDESHVQYYNRHFGYVLRPSRTFSRHDSYSPGLHHICLRLHSIDDVITVSEQLRSAGIDASAARNYTEYASDYWATFFSDPDGIRLEVTNYRQERRERYDNW